MTGVDVIVLILCCEYLLAGSRKTGRRTVRILATILVLIAASKLLVDHVDVLVELAVRAAGS